MVKKKLKEKKSKKKVVKPKKTKKNPAKSKKKSAALRKKSAKSKSIKKIKKMALKEKTKKKSVSLKSSKSKRSVKVKNEEEKKKKPPKAQPLHDGMDADLFEEKVGAEESGKKSKSGEASGPADDANDEAGWKEADEDDRELIDDDRPSWDTPLPGRFDEDNDE